MKQKHQLPLDKDIVVVEKSNTFKFTVKTVAALVRLLATIVIITLAFIGLIAIIYPDPRSELLLIWQEVSSQLSIFLKDLLR